MPEPIVSSRFSARHATSAPHDSSHQWWPDHQHLRITLGLQQQWRHNQRRKHSDRHVAQPALKCRRKLAVQRHQHNHPRRVGHDRHPKNSQPGCHVVSFLICW